jgi:hypothetical protein
MINIPIKYERQKAEGTATKPKIPAPRNAAETANIGVSVAAL